MTRKIRVLIVDDSKLLCAILGDILNRDPEIEVAGIAYNGQQALELARELKPDLITMDIEMPVMDGLSALKRIMAEMPRPVIMLSGLTQTGARITMECLEAGALDYIAKPLFDNPGGIRHMAEEITATIKAIYKQFSGRILTPRAAHQPVIKRPVAPSSLDAKFADRVVAIGISTGGPGALSEIFPSIPENYPPVLVVQHMPKEFTGQFAERLNRISRIYVKEAEDGDILLPGRAYIAPGDRHLTVRKSGTQVRIVLMDTEKVDGHRPSATVMFRSLAPVYGSRAVGVIMTGMGRDGVDGLRELRALGAPIIGQDQESCVVYSMPCIAAKEGVVDYVAPLNDILRKISLLLAGISGSGNGV